MVNWIKKYCKFSTGLTMKWSSEQFRTTHTMFNEIA